MTDPWFMAGLILIGITASLALLFAFFRPPIQSVSPREARELLHDGWISQVVDVRSPAEYAQGHYHNAINVPIRHITTALPHEVRKRDHAILLYGYPDGSKGFQAATLAQELGYSNVRYLRYGSYDEMENKYLVQ
jgi:rhodanese-related sulfurtransferase